MGVYGGVLLPDGRVPLVPHMAGKPTVYNPAVMEMNVPDTSYAGGVLLPDGRVLLVSCYGAAKTVIFDPATDTVSVETPSGNVPGS